MKEVLVIGGGIIGLLTAKELMTAGAAITLVEMGQTGRQSSWAGGGILSPLYPWQAPEAVTALSGWSQAIYPSLTTELLDTTDVDPELTQSGMLIMDTAELDLATAWSARHGQRLEVVDKSTLHQIEPELGPRPERALLFPEIRQLRTPRLSRAVRRYLEKRIKLREREEVLELIIDGNRAVGVRTPKGRIEAEQTIVCAGAWTAKLLEQLDNRPEIQPVRGQMILFYAKPGQINHITLHDSHYAIPRRDGRVLFGSTIEHAGFSKRTTAEDKEALYRNAVELFPILKRTPIEDHWAGLRPGSPNGIPYIGGYPGISGLYFNAGHYRNGLVTGPASARLVADLALGRPPTLDPGPYALTAAR
ncbi:glycine oxidase ThiO [Thiorhodococcus mannitoliphagus]|uniref:Glycine oxidase ThiO n=1 Tax=Thiorhodococcus mannitoliphagus TaxID=329406 RepID=A0A6P1DXT3_9GAMM|nr:glycine oxidase ThiO [Thiorhodococcus mannitoliphagus]NEX23137.1 glycine oxidase ThiO [Thiorhodococcus mannitoliphagus]